MKAIVAVDKNWAIGYQGRLLVSIRADQQNFKNLTMGKTIVYGRKTLETFPRGVVLPGSTAFLGNVSRVFRPYTIVFPIVKFLKFC